MTPAAFGWPVQVFPGEHVFPQAPQFVFVFSGTHFPLQHAVGMPLTGVQTFPQAPQFFASELTFAQ